MQYLQQRCKTYHTLITAPPGGMLLVSFMWKWLLHSHGEIIRGD